nr:pre-mRNA-processing factor 39-like isoform X2 [Nomia melanderi]
MSSASGDETEIALNEPVRRTRSSRTRKTAVVAKKSPVKKLLARATRSPKKVQEIEEIEEEESVFQGEVVMESIPENGVQRFTDIIQQHDEDESSMLHLELDDSTDAAVHEINMNQSVQIEEDQENVPDSETSESQIDHSTVVSDHMIIEESSMDKVDMLNDQEQIDMEGQDTSNDETNQRVLIDFQEVITDDGEPITQVTEILESEEIEPENVLTEDAGIEVMEVDDSQQEVSEVVENVTEMLPDRTEETEISEITEVMDADAECSPRSTIKKTEPDTEAVSEDELPTEAAAKEPETEAVSDEELPAAAPADLGETESVSEDELPPDSEKKKKSGMKAMSKTPEKKNKTEGGSKRKLNAEGEYDPSSPTSENNDETPAKKVALSTETEVGDNKQETKPASPKKKTLPELEKYWKAVNEDPSDFTGWTYLLQYVDQENDAEAAREAYTKFLERYPYCYGYWRKFADYEKKKGNPENVQRPSTSCGTYTTLSVYQIASYLIILRYLQYYCEHYCFTYTVYTDILHTIRKSSEG